MSNTLLHCFDCNFKTIISKVKQIKDTGYNGIQVGPVQQCKYGDEFWKLYQPLSFQVGNRLGSYEELKELVRICHEDGLIVIVDVVLRHLAGTNDGRMEFNECCDRGIVSNQLLTMNHNGDITDHKDRWQMVNMNAGMPTLNYYSEELWNRCYMPFLDCLLRDIGADGLRIDQMKHLALPEEGCNLLKNISERYADKYIYGEAINLGEVPGNYMEKYAKYAGLLLGEYEYYWDDRKTIYFVESHDTYLTFGYTRWMSDDDRINKWLTLATRGVNKLYYSRSNMLDDNTIFCKHMKWINQYYK